MIDATHLMNPLDRRFTLAPVVYDHSPPLTHSEAVRSDERRSAS
jgi:hypothetical protein